MPYSTIVLVSPGTATYTASLANGPFSLMTCSSTNYNAEYFITTGWSVKWQWLDE